MKLSTDLFNASLDFDESNIWTLIVENPVVLRRVILGLQDLGDSKQDSFLVYDDGRLLPLQDTLEVIQSVLPFDLNTKELISALVKRMEKKALTPEWYLETQQILQSTSLYLGKIAENLPTGILFDKLTPSSLLKAAGPEILADDTRLHCCLIQYMRLVRELIHDKIFVFLHLEELLAPEECNTFINEIRLNHLNVILLESRLHPDTTQTHTLLIDNDLCEIKDELGQL